MYRSVENGVKHVAGSIKNGGAEHWGLPVIFCPVLTLYPTVPLLAISCSFACASVSFWFHHDVIGWSYVALIIRFRFVCFAPNTSSGAPLSANPSKLRSELYQRRLNSKRPSFGNEMPSFPEACQLWNPSRSYAPRR